MILFLLIALIKVVWLNANSDIRVALEERPGGHLNQKNEFPCEPEFAQSSHLGTFDTDFEIPYHG